MWLMQSGGNGSSTPPWGACPSHFALPAVSQNAHPGAGMALIEYFTAAKSNKWIYFPITNYWKVVCDSWVLVKNAKTFIYYKAFRKNHHGIFLIQPHRIVSGNSWSFLYYNSLFYWKSCKYFYSTIMSKKSCSSYSLF